MQLYSDVLTGAFAFLLVGSDPLGRHVDARIQHEIIDGTPSFNFSRQLLDGFVGFIGLDMVHERDFLEVGPYIIFSGKTARVKSAFDGERQASVGETLLFGNIIGDDRGAACQRTQKILQRIRTFVVAAHPFRFIDKKFGQIADFYRSGDAIVRLTSDPQFR